MPHIDKHHGWKLEELVKCDFYTRWKLFCLVGSMKNSAHIIARLVRDERPFVLPVWGPRRFISHSLTFCTHVLWAPAKALPLVWLVWLFFLLPVIWLFGFFSATVSVSAGTPNYLRKVERKKAFVNVSVGAHTRTCVYNCRVWLQNTVWTFWLLFGDSSVKFTVQSNHLLST